MSKKNAYYFYMVEFKDQLMKEVGKEMSLHEASLAASDSWKKMTDEEKSQYKEMAKDAKNEPWFGNGGKRKKVRPCCKPKSAAKLLEEQELVEKALAMRHKVNDWLQSELESTGNVSRHPFSSKLSSKSIFITEMQDIAFTLIHINMFYENIPAEVSLVRFSLKKGIIKGMNDLVCVKKLPLGAAYEANKVSMETHGLPLPPKAKGQGSFSYLLEKINQFIGSNVVFCRPDDVENVSGGLQYLRDNSENPTNNDGFILLDMVELLLQLINSVKGEEQSVLDSYESVKKYLAKDPLDSLVKGCDVHCEMDRDKFCSESIVKRAAFQCIMACSKYLKLDLVSGVHMPERA